MANVVVNHREGEADAEDCHYTERHCGIGHELIGLFSIILHFGQIKGIWFRLRKSMYIYY
jgi:hypothetical protein